MVIYTIVFSVLPGGLPFGLVWKAKEALHSSPKRKFKLFTTGPLVHYYIV